MTDCPHCAGSCTVLIKGDPDDPETWREDICRACVRLAIEEEAMRERRAT